jgi:hypothetical protein
MTLLAACSGSGTSGTPTEQPANKPATTDQGPSAIARRVVAEHTGTALENVSIISVEAIEFPDSSLGCPDPNMAYLQVITSGHKVIAEYADKRYDVRLSGRHGFVCQQRARKSPSR